MPASGENSFPSAHAAFFFALAAAMYARRSRWAWPFVVVAVLISTARVAAAVHWPGDVLTGALLGLVVAWLVQFFYNLSTRRY